MFVWVEIRTVNPVLLYSDYEWQGDQQSLTNYLYFEHWHLNFFKVLLFSDLVSLCFLSLYFISPLLLLSAGRVHGDTHPHPIMDSQGMGEKRWGVSWESEHCHAQTNFYLSCLHIMWWQKDVCHFIMCGTVSLISADPCACHLFRRHSALHTEMYRHRGKSQWSAVAKRLAETPKSFIT